MEEFRTYDERHKVKCGVCNVRAEKLLSKPAAMMGMQYRDLAGEIIGFPKDGRPYFDKALRRTFNTPKEKQAWMKENKIVMDGSSDKSQNSLPIEAGRECTGNRVSVGFNKKEE